MDAGPHADSWGEIGGPGPSFILIPPSQRSDKIRLLGILSYLVANASTARHVAQWNLVRHPILMRATTALLLVGLLPALGEYFEPAGTAASAVSSDDNAKELGGKTTTTRKKKARKPAGYDVDNL